MVQWSDVFRAVETGVFEVAAQYWEGAEEAAKLFAAGSADESYLMAGDTTVWAFLDGGIVSYEDTGWGVDEDHSYAFGLWVEEREAAGQEWDEDDFEWEADPDALSSGIYVVGVQAMRLTAEALGVTEAGPAAELRAGPPIDHLGQLAAGGRSLMEDAADQARHVLRCFVAEDWRALLTPPRP